MSFERVSANSASGHWFNPLSENEASIAKTGQACLRLESLMAADIGDEAALLIGQATLRIALRRPRRPEDEGSIARVTPVKRRGKAVKHRMTVLLGSAIRQLGLTLQAVGGQRYALTTKDDLLIINLGAAQPAGDRKQELKGK